MNNTTDCKETLNQPSPRMRSPWAWVPTLYFAEGLPNVLVTAVAVVVYLQMGMTDTEIGLYTAWLGLPWVIKPFWSPFVDLYKTKRWWVLTMQVLLGSSLAGVAFTLNTPAWFQGTMCCFFIMAFASATHDISADGFYMLDLDEHTQTYFVGIRNTFYRLAVIFGNGVLIPVAGNRQATAQHSHGAWCSTVWPLFSSGYGCCIMSPCHARQEIRNDKHLPKPSCTD